MQPESSSTVENHFCFLPADRLRELGSYPELEDKCARALKNNNTSLSLQGSFAWPTVEADPVSFSLKKITLLKIKQ